MQGRQGVVHTTPYWQGDAIKVHRRRTKSECGCDQGVATLSTEGQGSSTQAANWASATHQGSLDMGDVYKGWSLSSDERK